MPATPWAFPARSWSITCSRRCSLTCAASRPPQLNSRSPAFVHHQGFAVVAGNDAKGIEKGRVVERAVG
jgi:hypothetical protein